VFFLVLLTIFVRFWSVCGVLSLRWHLGLLFVKYIFKVRMMNKFFMSLVLVLMTATGVCFASVETEVYVESSLVSGTTWLLDYIVKNKTLEAVNELTIEFDFDSFDNLVDVSGAGASCDIKVWLTIPQTHDGWAFDVVFDTPLGIGGSFTGISMQVDYLGGGDPLMQYYEVVDPVTFVTIADGYTVPEPVTLLLLGLGGLVIGRKR